MAYTEKRIIPGSTLTNAVVTYYTVTAIPPVLKTIVKEMTFCNTSASPVTVSVYIVPQAGVAGVANIEFSSVTIQPGETKIFGRTCVMEQGSTIQGVASTPGVVAFSASGVERT